MLQILQYATSDLFVFLGCFILLSCIISGIVSLVALFSPYGRYRDAGCNCKCRCQETDETDEEDCP